MKCLMLLITFVQSLLSSRRHNYTVHGIGTPSTVEDLSARQSGTECSSCKDEDQRDSTPSNPAKETCKGGADIYNRIEG